MRSPIFPSPFSIDIFMRPMFACVYPKPSKILNSVIWAKSKVSIVPVLRSIPALSNISILNKLEFSWVIFSALMRLALTIYFPTPVPIICSVLM